MAIPRNLKQGEHRAMAPEALRLGPGGGDWKTISVHDFRIVQNNAKRTLNTICLTPSPPWRFSRGPPRRGTQKFCFSWLVKRNCILFREISKYFIVIAFRYKINRFCFTLQKKSISYFPSRNFTKKSYPPLQKIRKCTNNFVLTSIFFPPTPVICLIWILLIESLVCGRCPVVAYSGDGGLRPP